MPEPCDAEPYLAMKTVMMPSDTNPHGTIFAGVILSRMALAGVVGARHAIESAGWPKPLLVARGMKRVEFRQAVLVGDLVCFFTRVLKIGKASITLRILAETERDGGVIALAEAEATYVAVEGDCEPRRPVAIRGK
jgi:acyl-CoA thioesterase YciA